MTWRLAKCITTLQDMVNHEWPGRSKVSDGTIGDARHQGQGQQSDHNPWIQAGGVGIVRAFDITCNGIPHWDVAEYIRRLGLNGDIRLANGGYVIHERQIASNIQNWAWRTYTGSDPHSNHIHVSVSILQEGFDWDGPWVWPNSTRPQPRKRDTMPKPILVVDPEGAVWTLTPGSLHHGRAHVPDPANLQAILDDDVALQALTGETWLASRNVFAWPQNKLDAYFDARPSMSWPPTISTADIQRIVSAVGAAIVKGTS